MAIAVSLWFDPALEAAVRGMWADLALEGITHGMHTGPYRPHVTLGAWDTMTLAPLVTDLRRLAADAGSFELVLDALGTFEDRESVVFLRPRPVDALASIHARVHALAAAHGSGVHPFHVAGAWNPHCTLAWGLEPARLARTIAFLRDIRLPPPGRAVALGVIETPAEIELERLALRP